MKTITIVEVNDISMYPPVQNLIRTLLSVGYQVHLIGRNLKSISEDIKLCGNCDFYEIGTPRSSRLRFFNKIINRLRIRKKALKYLDSCMRDSDYLWTTSMATIRDIGNKALQYKNILQLMELSKYGYVWQPILRFPIDKIARQSWKTVVPEINRAYIQKVWWDLPRTPYVLPNKPFSIDPGTLTNDVQEAIQKMKQEKKKIILYLGVICSDRNFDTYATAIEQMNDYAFYVAGKIFSSKEEYILQDLLSKHNVVYLGAFDPPKHLVLVQYAHIGLLPYKPEKGDGGLNALYCAPNKIYEYAGFGVPMVGSDVLGLRQTFEKWNIGRCCDFNDTDSIAHAINEVDDQHDEMSKNCYPFFDSVDLHKIIIEDILEDT